MPATIRSIAIVPAAGASRRMGRPKLTLPWQDSTVIESVLDRWRKGQVDATIVVVRPGDQKLAAICAQSGAQVAVPAVAPDDMKASLIAGLRFAIQSLRLADDWYWLTAPADMPTLSAAVIGQLCAEFAAAEENACVPVYKERRGHPVIVSGSALASLEKLPAGSGLNDLLRSLDAREIPSCSEAICRDLDTQADYERMLALQTGE